MKSNGITDIHKLVDTNLDLISKKSYFMVNNLRNEQGKEIFHQTLDFNQLLTFLIQNRLVDRERDRLDLTVFAYEVLESGGWLKYLENKKIVDAAEAKQKKEDDRLARKKIENETILLKWQKVTYWPVLILATVTSAYTLVDLFKKDKPTEQPAVETVVEKDTLKSDTPRKSTVVAIDTIQAD